MAKRQTVNQQNTPTKLSIPKIEFEAKIEELISEGKEILSSELRTEEQFTILKDKFSHWYDYTREYLKQKFNIENNEYKRGFEDAGSFTYGMFLGGNKSKAQEAKDFGIKVQAKVDYLIKLKAKVELLKSEIESNNITIEKPQIQLDQSQVFIVHGHDEEAKVKVARFIEKIGFKPIILHEQASSGKTIIEKIEEYSNVGFGIVLYTPCDLGAKNDVNPNYKNRARQNVVFEHGYLIGKIGRPNVCALVKGEIETPNDISGVVYITMDSGDAWHIQIAKEMKKSGYNVDMNKVIE